jgi:ribonuclease HI
LNTKDFGGFNLANVRDKYHSAQITAFQTAILDYDSPAKRELKRLERELNESSSFKQPITMPENTVWDEIIYILQKRRSTIHTTLPSKQNQQNLEEILTKAQKQREFEKLLKIINKSNSHVTAEQLYDAIIDQHTVEINSTAQIHEKIARLEKGDIISEEARLYEPEATHTISEISRKIRGKNREKPITMPVFENIGGRETRYSTVEYQGETWEINFTDGSAKNKIAAWGAYIPIGGKLKIPENKENLEIKQTQMFYGRVEGEQTNIRAELQAILTVLSRKETTKKNQMIVLDSEYSEKEIKAWKSKTKKKRRLTENRDMMKQIQNKIDFIENGANGPRIIFVHVYSHQKEAGTHSDPKRKEKIEKQKEEFGNDKLYQILVNGNEIADKLAEKGRRSTEHQRDWALEPTQGNDKFYVITDDIINDKKPQIWIKEQTQSDTYIKRTEQKHNENSRNDYLHYLPICNRALSFQAGKIRNHKQHHIYLVLARIRFHAAPTLKILSKQISQREWTDPFRTYYKEMYPTPNCHFCEKKNVKIEEDTTHMLNCPNRNSRNEVAEELWNQIWEMIEKKQQNDDPKKWETRKKKRDIKNQNRGRKRKEERGNDSKKKRGKNKKNDEEEEEEENLLNPAAHLQKPNPRLLRPFAMRTEGTLASHEAAVAARGGIPLPRSLEGLAAFPDGAAGYALIPESLCRALRELWVLAEDAHSLAAEIAQSVQKAVVREYHMRCRTIAEERDAKGKFAHHVLGK